MTKNSQVVEQLSVKLAVLNTELEVLQTTERSKKLSTELVCPVGEESKLVGLSKDTQEVIVNKITNLASDLEATRSLSGVVDLLAEGRRTSTGGRVPGTVTVKKVHLGDCAARGDERAGVRKTIVGRVN